MHSQEAGFLPTALQPGEQVGCCVLAVSPDSGLRPRICGYPGQLIVPGSLRVSRSPMFLSFSSGKLRGFHSSRVRNLLTRQAGSWRLFGSGNAVAAVL